MMLVPEGEKWRITFFKCGRYPQKELRRKLTQTGTKSLSVTRIGSLD